MAATSRSPRLRLISSEPVEQAPLAFEAATPARDVELDSSDVRAGAPVDEDLVGRARRADAFAFEALYRRHAEFAFNLAVRIQGSSADVEDVVHDAFLKAQERLEDLRDTA